MWDIKENEREKEEARQDEKENDGKVVDYEGDLMGIQGRNKLTRTY